ncbi:MAG: hypothetical protein ACI84C_000970 [Flavobacteriales bacterium]|jgi:hypothetical protein
MMKDNYKQFTSITIVSQFIGVLVLIAFAFSSHFSHGQSSLSRETVVLTVSSILDSDLEECSGAVFFDENSLLVHNDGGNAPRLFRVGVNDGRIIQEAEVKGKDNKDWEDIAEGPDAWYIGDFGNNGNGKRTDLRVLKILKSEWEEDKKFGVKAKSIKFDYPEQDMEAKKSKPQSTNWDCESLIWFDGELHLFTKEWSSHKTKHYVLPTEPGEFYAKLLEEFDVQGMVTGASVTEKGRLVLLGYSSLGLGFLWSFEGDKGMWFNSDKRKYNLGSVNSIGQVEGVVMKSETIGYITSERWEHKKHKVSPTIYRFEL